MFAENGGGDTGSIESERLMESEDDANIQIDVPQGRLSGGFTGIPGGGGPRMGRRLATWKMYGKRVTIFILKRKL